MTESELRDALRAWGREFGPRPMREWDEDTSDGLAGSTHVLLRAVRAGTRAEPSRRRTRTYRDAAGKLQTEPAPANPCYGRESQGGSKRMWINPVAEQVEVAVLRLYGIDRIQAVVLRMQYCTGQLFQSEKAKLASNALDMRISKRRFRHELYLARAQLNDMLSLVAKSAA